MSDLTPRVRFCPAPSGWLHVGSVRAALYNFLHARRHGGTFVFRIEDTDATRATDESMLSMMEAMRWIGLDWDEGPDVDGEIRGAHGPYRQSERGALYAAVVRRLVDAGEVYPDFRSSEELEAWRASHRRGEGEGPPVVKAATFEHTPEEIARFEAEGRVPSLRLRTPDDGAFVVDDLVRGAVRWEWEQISDPVIQRSDGSATYPLANSVDDVAQGITLICRGEDLLSVTPRQGLIHDLLTRDRLIDEALAEVGMPARDPSWTQPEAFAHLPMVVGMDRKKLSKRHGSVAIQQFRRKGFLPETLRNFLALLGWSPGDGRERLEDDELIALFDLSAVGRSAAAFDEDKLLSFNGDRIRDLSVEDLAGRLVEHLDGTLGERALVDSPPTEAQMSRLVGLVPLIQERMQRLDEVENYAPAFFIDDLEIDPDAVDRVLSKPPAVDAIAGARRLLSDVDWSVDAIDTALRGLAEELGSGFGRVAQPIRVAVTGSTVSPPLF
ncbi:MAG: glutamate--tRNA ligase family protein, partial [Nitriliruptoraceae bacterium]